MLDASVKNIESFLGEALSWSGLKCRVNALYKQWNGGVKVIAHIPNRYGETPVRMTQRIADSFCGDVELNDLDQEGREYKAVFTLQPGALADGTD